MRTIVSLMIAGVAAAAVAGPASACAFDGIPGYSHYATADGSDPYAGAYVEAAARIAEQRRAEAIENARQSFLKRLGMKDEGAAPVETAAAAAAPAAQAQPNP